MKRPPGRPRLPEGSAKTGMLAVRLSSDGRHALKELAKAADAPVTSFARDVIVSVRPSDVSATKLIQQAMLGKIPAKDCLDRFAEILKKEMS